MDQYFEALEKSKNSIALNIVEQMGFDETADVLKKGRAAQMGEMRIWNGVKYQKTPQGWVPVKSEEKAPKAENKEEKSAEKQERGQFNSGIDWSKAEKEYVECPSFKSNYDTGDGPEEIKSIKLYEDYNGWEVIGNEIGQIVFEGKAGQSKKFKTKEAAIKAVEDAIKKTQK